MSFPFQIEGFTMRKKNNKSYYISTFWTITVYAFFTIMLLCISFFVFLLFKALFVKVFQVEQSIGDMISLIVSIIVFILPLIPQIKNTCKKIINKTLQKIYMQHRKKTIKSSIKTTTEQETIINEALRLLKSNEGHLIALEGSPNKGKTTTAILLFDNIGNDINLFELFVQLQHQIYYIDAGYEKNFLMDHLNNNIDASKSLTIIDNVHKLSSNLLILMLNKISSITKYADNIGSKNLIVLLYEDSNNNPTKRIICEYLNREAFEDDGMFFKLNTTPYNNDIAIEINPIFDVDGAILNRIKCEYNELIQSHLLNLYTSGNNNKLLKLLLEMLSQSPNCQEVELLQLTTIVIVLSMHCGFVTQDAILKVWENTTTQFKRKRCLTLIRNFHKNGFFTLFPFIKKTYLFNESIALEYKKRFFPVKQFKNYYYKCTDYLYKSKFYNSIELEWANFITCSPSEILSIPEFVKEDLFYSSIETMNKSYALQILEEEITLDTQKNHLFDVELGILYIKTGQWNLARQILKPYISNKEINEKLIQLQLQIIEADHGVDAIENLEILKKIKNSSCDGFIQLQAEYWQAHIKMEQGDFNLTVWEALQNNIEVNLHWKNQHTYAHLIHRITADSCRTFFLKGNNNYNFFNKTLSFFNTHKVKPNLQEDLALEELENAHYIHYELVYQLGIWRMYRFPHDKNRSFLDSVNLRDLIDSSLTLYDKSITRFLKAGNKTWRTAQIRRAELSLCSPTPNFVELLSQLNDFEKYSSENSVDVFSGYIACLKGKAYALYALTVFLGNEDSSYEMYLKKSSQELRKSIQIYNHYGNDFGALRSELLFIIVNTIKNMERTKDQAINLEDFKSRAQQLQKQFSSDNIREQQVLKYLTDMSSLKISDFINILKYYPIVLQ